MSFVNERKERLKDSRTIDYERNAILTVGNTQGWYSRVSYAESFTLVWKEEKIEFGALYKIELFKEDGSSARLTYHIERCVYPENLKAYKKEIIEMVVEALQVYGVKYGTQEGTEIIVKISPSLGSLQINTAQSGLPSPEVSKSFH